jgi:hypothetical protein
VKLDQVLNSDSAEFQVTVPQILGSYWRFAMYSKYVDTGYFSATASQDTIHYTFPSTNTSRELKLASNQFIRDLWMTPDYVVCRIETSA